MSLSKIDVANMVTGAVPVANGGTALTSAFYNGISMAQIWRLTSNFSGDGFWTNLEADDTDGYGQIGTMSNSSGVLTFPSTGYYLVHISANFKDPGASQRFTSAEIYYTADNSSYAMVAKGVSSVPDETSSSDNNNGHASISKIFDITNTTNQKIKAYSNVNSDASLVTAGDSNDNESIIQIIRLGDT